MRARLFGIAAIALSVLAPGAADALTVQRMPLWKGTEIWVAPDHTLPIVSLTLSLPAGSAYDAPGKDGLAAFAGDLLDEGAGNLDSAAFHAALNNRAIQLGVSTDRDYTVVSLVTLSDNVQEAFALLGLALLHPRFDPATVARVRSQVIASIAESEEDPGSVAAKAFFASFFRGHPYAHDTDGDPASLSRITPQDIRTFAQGHWVRGGAKIAVAGDIDPAKLKTLLVSSLGRLSSRIPPWLPVVRHMGAPGTQVIAMSVPQPNIVFGLPGLVRSDRDYIPAYVMNYILGGGGFSSRLTAELREKRGLTYGVSTSLAPYRKAGVFVGQVATKKESVRQAIDVIRDTIKTFVNDGPTDKEMADAKTYLTGSFPLAFDSNTGISAQLASFQRAGLNVDYLDKRNALMNAVTADDVRRVAKRLLDPARLTVVVAGSPGQAKALPRPAPQKKAADPKKAPVPQKKKPAHRR